MKLTKDEIDLIIFALNREIDLERMGEQEIVDFVKENNGVDPCYIIELQGVLDEFETYLEEGGEEINTALPPLPQQPIEEPMN